MKPPLRLFRPTAYRTGVEGVSCCILSGMAAFDDVLGQLRAWKPGDENPDPPATLYDDLAREYQRLADQRDGATVKLSEKDALLAAREAEVSRLKGENYDLASRIGFKTEETEEPPEQKASGINGLFTKRARK